MRSYTKEKAIACIVNCAKTYKKELVNKQLLFVCSDCYKNIICVELSFDASNFLHLTGLKTNNIVCPDGSVRKLSATEFYKRCVNNKISPKDFEFSKDGTTNMKLNVLPKLISKNLSAKMIGNYNSIRPKLVTDKLVGNVAACMGFVLTKNDVRYVPNTVIQEDIRKCATDIVQVVAVFRKEKNFPCYSECTYKSNKYDWSDAKISDEYSFLKDLLSDELNSSMSNKDCMLPTL